MSSALENLKKHTIVVADTGDFSLLEKYQPTDATTNPTLILAVSQDPKYRPLLDEAVAYAKAHSAELSEQLSLAMDKVAVNFGIEILRLIPGRVSTEIDARLSFDTAATIAKGREIIKLYEEAGIAKDRILLKIASTWEGLQAAKVLEEEGLHVNMTLMFNLYQAIVAAESNVTLISPFAGRITDFYKQRDKVESYIPSEDPGVVSVRTIYEYYKTYGYKTVVMGASFRTKEQVLELAGCDLLTVSPSLLEQLRSIDQEVERKLNPETQSNLPKVIPTESQFRFQLNDDEMAENKLSDGIRRFAADAIKLENQLKGLLTA
eukprot:TRINITY_DN2805_c0_g1_i1.p1 TRINITY_DN2805_c0_g1~~TRINITY_DN2805_c0_g1_i1.p1  ORF type:complete len:350 (+),score=175.84 TRINITY_DN2805_c0_g1_i1:91-1050(+)